MRLAALSNQPVQLSRHPDARQRCVGHQHQAFAAMIINDAQHAEPATIGEAVADKVA